VAGGIVPGLPGGAGGSAEKPIEAGFESLSEALEYPKNQRFPQNRAKKWWWFAFGRGRYKVRRSLKTHGRS
jgi:hypothetical protein